MNKQIKQRIKQINNGQVPEGYSRTTAGIIPKEWHISSLDSLLDFKNGINTAKEKYGRGIKMISIIDVLKNTPIHYDDIIGQVDIDIETLDTYSVNYGDILFQRSSEIAKDAGKSNVYLDKENTATYSGFVIRGKKKADYFPYFLNESLKKYDVRKQIIRSAAGSQHINIGQESLEKIEVCLPSIAEQEKIAEILMKWDEAIELHEKLFNELLSKRYYLLQQIFSQDNCTQKICLGEFIDEVCERNTMNCKNIMSVSNTKGFINQTKQFSKQVASEDVKNYKVVRKGYIAYNPSRINVGSIAIYKDDLEGVVSPMYNVFKCRNIEPNFLLIILETARGKYEIKSLLSGSVRESLSFDDLKSIELSVPEEEKWSGIKSLFKCIDNYLEKQLNRVDTLKQQRKALQQYLLNGIVRVKV